MADPMTSSYRILFACPAGVDQSRVKVQLPAHEQEFARAVHPRDKEIRRAWDAKLAAHPRMFNGTKFRLHAGSVDGDGVCLRLGITDYMTYIGIREAGDEFRTALRAAGEAAGCDMLHFSCNMGCAPILVTSDGHLLLIRRSESLPAYPGMVQLAGAGHPEPSHAGVASAQELCQADPAKVAAALFADALLEVNEETNVPLHELAPPKLLGCVLDVHDDNKPTLIFLTSCGLTAREVQHCYSRGAPDAFESTELLSVSAADPEAGLDLSKVDPCTLGALQLWKAHVEQLGGSHAP